MLYFRVMVKLGPYFSLKCIIFTLKVLPFQTILANSMMFDRIVMKMPE